MDKVCPNNPFASWNFPGYLLSFDICSENYPIFIIKK